MHLSKATLQPGKQLIYSYLLHHQAGKILFRYMVAGADSGSHGLCCCWMQQPLLVGCCLCCMWPPRPPASSMLLVPTSPRRFKVVYCWHAGWLSQSLWQSEQTAAYGGSGKAEAAGALCLLICQQALWHLHPWLTCTVLLPSQIHHSSTQTQLQASHPLPWSSDSCCCRMLC